MEAGEAKLASHFPSFVQLRFRESSFPLHQYRTTTDILVTAFL